jgi:RND family efflux transporter MFP subunit
VTDLKQDLSSLRLPVEGAAVPRRRWALLSLIPVAIGVGVVFVLTGRGRAVEVETVPATREAIGAAGSPVLTASGYVVARRRAVVSAKIQGRLAVLKVEEGARVEEGEVFAELESDDFRAAVTRARAQIQRAEAGLAAAQAQVGTAEAQVARSDADLAEAERQLRVSERLAKDELVPGDTVEAGRSRVAVTRAAGQQARADVRRAAADVDRARAERAQADADLRYNEALLQNTLIRAPFTGTVVRKMAEVGESVAPIPPGVNISTASGAIVALADLDTLEVEVDVAEANVARLVAGQPADVIVEAFPDRKYSGVLRQVIPTADRTRATVMVKVTIRDKDANLKPEMSAKVTFLEPARTEAAAAPVVMVPQGAVATRDGGTFVFTVADGVATARKVVLGAARQDRVIVVDGLSGNESVVLRPDAALQDGARVRVKS